MASYEMVVILKPNLDEEVRQTVLDRLQSAMTEKGKVDKVDDWGSRKLAYDIDYNKEGYYYVISYTADPSVVFEVERRARLLDQVLRFMTVKIDEKAQKKVAAKPETEAAESAE